MDEEPAATPQNAPKIATSMRLSPERGRASMDFAINELDKACLAMGRGKDGSVTAGSWLDKTPHRPALARGDVSWREGDLDLGAVFNDPNFTRFLL